MKKITKIFALMLVVANLVGCATKTQETTEVKDTFTITSLNGNKEEIQLEVPFDPQRVAILDMPSMDIIDNLGLGDRIVGSAKTSLDYLQKYVTDENVKNIGTIKEADLEAVASVEPDIIFIGGRLSESYDALSQIAPVVYLSIDTEIGTMESIRKNANTIASIFGKENEVEEKLAENAEGKNAIIGMATSRSFNILVNDGRCSIIGREIDYENIGIVNKEETSTNGNESSFELILELNPDYIFVLDKDAAIATEGAKLAKEIVENELVMKTDAYNNGNIVYLKNPAVWYTAEGGITALDIMLQDLESELLK